MADIGWKFASLDGGPPAGGAKTASGKRSYSTSSHSSALGIWSNLSLCVTKRSMVLLLLINGTCKDKIISLFFHSICIFYWSAFLPAISFFRSVSNLIPEVVSNSKACCYFGRYAH